MEQAILRILTISLFFSAATLSAWSQHFELTMEFEFGGMPKDLFRTSEYILDWSDERIAQNSKGTNYNNYPRLAEKGRGNIEIDLGLAYKFRHHSFELKVGYFQKFETVELSDLVFYNLEATEEYGDVWVREYPVLEFQYTGNYAGLSYGYYFPLINTRKGLAYSFVFNASADFRPLSNGRIRTKIGDEIAAKVELEPILGAYPSIIVSTGFGGGLSMHLGEAGNIESLFTWYEYPSLSQLNGHLGWNIKYNLPLSRFTILLNRN